MKVRKGLQAMQLAQIDRSMSPAAANMQQEHAELSQQVREAAKCPGEDSLKLSEMKRRKLRLKDKLASMGVATIKTR